MNRIVLAPVLILTLASTAFAEGTEPAPLRQEPGGYAAVAAVVGEDRFEFGGIAGELGKRIGQTTLFGRVMAQAGNTNLANDPGRGTYTQARAGVEARNCMYAGKVCGSIGLDVGVHRSRYEHVDLGANAAKARGAAAGENPLEERFDSVIAVPRFTLDGGGRIRVRGVVELPQHMRDGDSVSGFGLSLAVGVAF
jgi:hypothetical protein